MDIHENENMPQGIYSESIDNRGHETSSKERGFIGGLLRPRESNCSKQLLEPMNVGF
jgi:hypothetical protein